MAGWGPPAERRDRLASRPRRGTAPPRSGGCPAGGGGEALRAPMRRAAADLVPGGAGVRAQALDRHGNLLDDFHIVEAERSLHVLNAPSPAATASLAIGATIAERAASLFGLPSR